MLIEIYRFMLGSFTSPDFSASPELFSPQDRRIGSIAFAGDGSRVVFTACNLADGLGDCDIYEIEGYGTESARSVNIHSINSSDWEASPDLSDDGSIIFFTSNALMPLSKRVEQDIPVQDDANIFMSSIRDDGIWEAPRILREPINSSARDDTPFIGPGETILYFSSDRSGGYGGMDIYAAVRREDGTWTAYNLGYPINTEANERDFIISQNGKSMFFASNRKGDSTMGGYDIYFVSMKE